MKNKKVLIIAIVAVVAVLAVVLGVVLGGGNQTPDTTTTTTTKPAPAPATEKEYKLGMGAVAGGHDNKQANLTIATVVLDDAGKIVACRLDVAQNKYAVDGEEIEFTVRESKRELLERYNMKNASPIKKEWYEQAEAFEAWVVGKTGAEVAELLKKDNLVQSGTHWVSNDPVLKAGCTIDVQDFRDAVVKACNDDQGVEFKTSKTFKLGLGVNSENDKSSAENEENFTIKMNVEFAGSVVVDGKVIASVNDAYQPNIVVEDGAVTLATVGTFANDEDKNKTFMTKRELMETYGMKVANIDKGGSKGSEEWYVQSEVYSSYVVGKTASEIAGLALNDDLMNAGCTIYIGGINAVVAESVNNAR